MEKNKYIDDILSQPDDLRNSVLGFEENALTEVIGSWQSGHFDRIVITGMGSSYYAGYPVFLRLIQAGMQVWHMETSDLLHYSMPLITSRTILWVISQSGRSAEIVKLVEQMPRDCYLMAITNDSSSPLGQKASLHLPIHAGTEFTVSTRTYVNTLAVSQLACEVWLQGDVQKLREDFISAAGSIELYLSHWEEHVADLKARVGIPQRLIILSRGHSMTTVGVAALITKEAAKFAAEGQNASQFRHGPLEMADDRLTAMILSGDPIAVKLHTRLARNLIALGAHVFWISTDPLQEFQCIPVPSAQGIAQLAAEIIPFQMLTLALGESTGQEPGIFRNIGKVTLEE